MKMLNNKGSACVFIALVIMFGSWFGWAIHKVESSSPESVMVGDETDEHGCQITAGYVWDEELEKCVRPWELSNEVDVEHVFTWVYNRLKYDKPYEILPVTVLSPETYTALRKKTMMAIDYPKSVDLYGEEVAKKAMEFWSKNSTGFFDHHGDMAITIKNKFDVCENNGILVSLVAQYFWHIFEKPGDWDKYSPYQQDGIRISIAHLAIILQEEYCDTFCKKKGD